MTDTRLEAIQIIIKKCSPGIEKLALETKRDFEKKSPIAQARYAHLLECVFSEGFEFTAEEKEILAGALTQESDGKTVYLNIRLTAAEKAKLAIAAETEGITLSDYVRNKLLL